MAFFGGSIGVIYRQFSITLVSAMALSVLVALVLTPALCATMLKPLPPSGHVEHKGFFKWFNHWFDRGRANHGRGLDAMLRRPGRSMLVFVGIVVLTASPAHARAHFIPAARRPGLRLSARCRRRPALPRSAPGRRSTRRVNISSSEEKDVVEGVLTVNGFSFAGTGQNSGLIFIKLKDWDERSKDSQSMTALHRAHQQVLRQHQGGERHCHAAAGGAGAGQHRRLRFHVAEPRRV